MTATHAHRISKTLASNQSAATIIARRQLDAMPLVDLDAYYHERCYRELLNAIEDGGITMDAEKGTISIKLRKDYTAPIEKALAKTQTQSPLDSAKPFSAKEYKRGGNTQATFSVLDHLVGALQRKGLTLGIHQFLDTDGFGQWGDYRIDFPTKTDLMENCRLEPNQLLKLSSALIEDKRNLKTTSTHRGK